MGDYDKFLEAAGNGKLQQVKEYLDHGIDVNAKDESGETAIYKAAHEGHTAVVRLLIEKGGNVDAKNVHGETALFYACTRGHFDVVKLLIESGADVNERQNELDTPLIYMVSEAKFKRQNAEMSDSMETLPQRLAPLIKIIRLLIDNGADQVPTALFLAEQETLPDIVNVLKGAGTVDVDLASTGPRASLIVNHSIDKVWDFLTTARNWKKWHGPVPKVEPGWQEGATLQWEGGGKDTITRYIPQAELQMEDASIRTIFRLQPEGSASTRIEMIDIPIRGASYSDGGFAHQRTMNEELRKMKDSIEKGSNANMLVIGLVVIGALLLLCVLCGIFGLIIRNNS